MNFFNSDEPSLAQDRIILEAALENAGDRFAKGLITREQLEAELDLLLDDEQKLEAA